MKELLQFTEWLSERLKKTLPGLDAHLDMAPRFRILQIKDYQNIEHAKKSGVLILLYQIDGRIKTVVITRPKYAGVHSGQVSFPGGKFEEDDVNMVNTAIREAHEEVGILPEELKIVGELSQLYIPPSNFLVLPVIAYTEIKPVFHPDKKEVAGIEEILLDDLFRPEILSEKEIVINEYMKTKVPCFSINNLEIWGATAMIINELKVICSEYK